MPLPDRNETKLGYAHGLSLGLISPSPPHGQDTRGCHNGARTERDRAPDERPPDPHPSRRSFGTARRIRTVDRKPLGLNPWAGKSCPDPGRLSTFGVSGLCPCRSLTYRGACLFMLALRPGRVKRLGNPVEWIDLAAAGGSRMWRTTAPLPSSHDQHFAEPPGRHGPRAHVRRNARTDAPVA